MPAKTSTIPLYILKIELYKNITLINKNEEMVKPFIKMHGLGNDFVIIDSRNNQFLLNTKNIQLIANRRFGIGCDQVIEMNHSTSADIFMRIFNADGSESGSCGNAARCVASLLFAASPKKTVLIETITGIIKGESLENGNVKIDMGEPKFNWKDIPLKINKSKIDFPEFSLENGIVVNMGNPHIVFFRDNLNQIDMESAGPKIENNCLFPEKINVEVCQVLNKNKIRLKVWERGTGLTLACGTGACAALVAACKSNLTESTAEIVLDGGSLEICWNNSSDNHVIMSGPVSVSFLGEFSSLGEIK